MEVNEVKEVKVVDDNEEITSHEEGEAEQVQRLPTPEALLRPLRLALAQWRNELGFRSRVFKKKNGT